MSPGADFQPCKTAAVDPSSTELRVEIRTSPDIDGKEIIGDLRQLGLNALPSKTERLQESLSPDAVSELVFLVAFHDDVVKAAIEGATEGATNAIMTALLAGAAGILTFAFERIALVLKRNERELLNTWIYITTKVGSLYKLYEVPADDRNEAVGCIPADAILVTLEAQDRNRNWFFGKWMSPFGERHRFNHIHVRGSQALALTAFPQAVATVLRESGRPIYPCAQRGDIYVDVINMERRQRELLMLRIRAMLQGNGLVGLDDLRQYIHVMF